MCRLQRVPRSGGEKVGIWEADTGRHPSTTLNHLCGICLRNAAGPPRVELTCRLPKSPCFILSHPSLLTKLCGGGGVVTKSCPTLQPQWLQPTRLLCPWDFPGKNTGVGCNFPPQEGDPFFPTQGSNLYLLLGRQIPYPWATREAPLSCELLGN